MAWNGVPYLLAFSDNGKLIKGYKYFGSTSGWWLSDLTTVVKHVKEMRGGAWMWQTSHVIVVFRVDDSDAIQGHDSGYDSEGVKREKTVNRWSASRGASTLLNRDSPRLTLTRYQLKIRLENMYIKFNPQFCIWKLLAWVTSPPACLSATLRLVQLTIDEMS
jgi:hypothetical protein